MFCPDENLGMFQIMIINVHLTMTSGQSDQAMVTQSTISNNLLTFKSKRCLSTKFTGTTENYALRGFLTVKMFIQSDFRSVFEAEGFCAPIS